MTARALTCPACGAPVRVSAAGRSLSVLCSGCGATLDAATPELRLLTSQAADLAVPEIPLGTRAELDGTLWEVIGWLERERSDGSHRWQEYLLFNPWEGFCWLIDDDGFHLGTPIAVAPDAAGRTAILDGRDWHGTSRYDARVARAVGEFHWRIAVGDTVAVREYALGSRLLAAEVNGTEASWTLITPQPHGRIEALFGLSERAPPAEALPRLRELWPLHLGMAMAAMLAVLLIDATVPREEWVASTRLSVPIDGPTATTSIGPVTLPAGPHRIAIRVMDADRLDNQWIDLDYELVNRRTQASYPVDAVAEQYHGVDYDGPWSEGDRRPLRTMAAIPGGTYDLVIEATGRSWKPPRQIDISLGLPPGEQQIEIAVSRDGSFGANLFLAALALFLWPLTLAMFAAEVDDEDEDDW